MSILILTNRNPGNIYLVNRISERFDVSGRVILEANPRDSRDKYKFWMNKVKRYGLAKTINKYLFLKLQGNSVDDAAVTKRFFYPSEDNISYRFETDEMVTTDINSDAVAEFICSKSPELIAVCGSNLIKPHIFTLPPKGTINIHCGITPDYRCANPVEWAIFNKDFEKVGVTIHYINEGLDTGNIIAQKAANLEKGDTIKSLYCKNIVNGGDLMIQAIEDILNGNEEAIPQDTTQGHHYLSIEYGYYQSLKVNHILRKI
jgi:methionyl-tRNA formyltransferase